MLLKQLAENRTPMLGFGAMRFPMAGDKIDVEKVKNMVDLYLESGFKYFDTAYVYAGSEKALGEALVSRHPRENYYIAAKLPMWLVKEEKDMEKLFQEELSRLGTDYIDFYLIHNITDETAEAVEKYNAWGFVSELKSKGKVRHIGFSTHDTPEAIEKILKNHPEAEFIQLQINYEDWESEDVASRR